MGSEGYLYRHQVKNTALGESTHLIAGSKSVCFCPGSGMWGEFLEVTCHLK